MKKFLNVFSVAYVFIGLLVFLGELENAGYGVFAMIVFTLITLGVIINVAHNLLENFNESTG